MSITLGESSLRRLEKVHLDLVRVVHRAAVLTDEEGFGWIITCGIRSVEEQRRLVAKGASKTMRSRHLPGTGGWSHAVDFACTIDGQVRWDWPLYRKLAVIVKEAARIEGVPIEWGGDWRSFKDGPHFQLPWASYP